MPRTPSKLPSLGEFLSRNKTAFDLAEKAGVVRGTTWAEQEAHLRREHSLMSTMDDATYNSYLANRNRKEMPGLLALKEQLDKLINLKKMRNDVGDQLKGAKDYERRKK